MKLTVEGNIKPYYMQMLAMLWYPGEKFPEETCPDDGKSCHVTVSEKEDGVYSETVATDGEKTEKGEFFLKRGRVPDEMIFKLAAGGSFLEAMSALTGYMPPWGMLTGVRPANRAENLHTKGYSPDEAVRFFTDVYKTTEMKARLAVRTSEVSRRLVTPERRRECSVYIGIPFCPTRCAYCSFVSYTSPKLLSMIPDYLSSLVLDIDRTFSMINKLGFRVATVYIGGGTPTVLDERELEILLDAITRNVSGLDEFTLEAGRPDTITEEKLRIAKDHEVTRISVNTQTLDDGVLKAIGRAHTAEDFFKAYEIARNSGIRDVNVDLIAGLPGDTTENFSSSVDRVISLSPTNVTVHTFSVKKSSELKTGGHDVFDREGRTALESVDYSQRALTDAGYDPYYMYRQKNTVGNLENVGYSVPGHEGLYNIFMMDEIHSIFSCGASSVTKLMGIDKNGIPQIKRMFEHKYPYEYMRQHTDAEYESARLAREKEIFDFYSENRIV